MQHNQSSWVLVVSLILIGALFILVPELTTTGVLYDLRSVWQTIGGALLGAAGAIAISVLNSNRLIDRIFLVLEQSSEIVELAGAKDIRNFDKKYYYYYRTAIEGKVFWRMVRIDFSQGFGNVRLLSRVSLQNKAGQLEHYKVEAQSRFRRVVLYLYAEQKTIEPTMIAVFHVSDVSPYAGVKQLMTWDRSHIIVPCILSEESLIEFTTEQEKVPSAQAKILEGIWASEISADVDQVIRKAPTKLYTESFDSNN